MAGVPYNFIYNRLVRHGLDAKADYQVSDGKVTFTASGDVLISSGINAYLKGNYSSKMFTISKK